MRQPITSYQNPEPYRRQALCIEPEKRVVREDLLQSPICEVCFHFLHSKLLQEFGAVASSRTYYSDPFPIEMAFLLCSCKNTVMLHNNPDSPKRLDLALYLSQDDNPPSPSAEVDGILKVRAPSPLPIPNA
ncbi:unnamed protein product [Somion occarium]|uniref:Uncharacterized protein n=1 Tax=Somion occarium TaxID=3059160 RepID=A0ABP1D2X4_9APHY